ncbi:hypothetical protein [Embleya scabrispora]|uniref:hypothetical protein n=1 Tax=Embleya scabrispora TaxID=159449 RepID=UPI00036AD8A7|nr:hypothetical protein [Embleya scabrispora]MYS84666.1 hypothetical protein [Streptomyces sp. SID5474]
MESGILSEDERRAWCAITSELRLDTVSHRSARAAAASSGRGLRIIAAASVLVPVVLAFGVVAATRLSHPLVLAPLVSLAALGALPLAAWVVRDRRRRP